MLGCCWDVSSPEGCSWYTPKHVGSKCCGTSGVILLSSQFKWGDQKWDCTMYIVFITLIFRSKHLDLDSFLFLSLSWARSIVRIQNLNHDVTHTWHDSFACHTALFHSKSTHWCMLLALPWNWHGFKIEILPCYLHYLRFEIVHVPCYLHCLLTCIVLIFSSHTPLSGQNEAKERNLNNKIALIVHMRIVLCPCISSSARNSAGTKPATLQRDFFSRLLSRKEKRIRFWWI